MNRKLTGSAYSFVAVMAVAAFVIVMAWGYPPFSRLLPLLFGGIMFLIAALAFLWEVRKPQSQNQSEKSNQPSALMRAYLRQAGWIIGFLAAIWVFGLVVASAGMFAVYMRFHGTRWLIAIISAVAMPALLYVIFNLALDVELYKGLVFSLLK